MKKLLVLLIMIVPTLQASATTSTSLECGGLTPLCYRSHLIEVKAASGRRTPKSSATYACPMHPEVKSGAWPVSEMQNGSCPANRCYLLGNFSAGGRRGKGRFFDNKSLNIPDVEVLDQDGNVRHFYTDLIKGKTVAINFIFTNCMTICPPLGATFARVQRELGDKTGNDVHFISVSVDPLTDTPERLKAWGARFKAGAGWTFVTGNKQVFDELLGALGATAARRGRITRLL